MEFKVFTKIFDLDPKEVENFIIELTKENFSFDSEEEEKQWWEDFNLVVRWYPTHNQFYVFTDPNLKHEYNKEIKVPEIVKKQFPYYKPTDAFKFKDRDITIEEYLWHQFDHYHYNFREIYALMTGETEIWSVCYDTYDDGDDIEISYYGLYNKNYITVIKTKSGEWFLQKWIEDGGYIEERKEVPKELLDYVITLDPKEVELR